jgi:peptidoglycan/xylan/chitin deacetylase (PgdA/CDA1 family)
MLTNISVPILVYHQITTDDSSKNLSGSAVPISQFERQMHYLHDQGYSCVSLMELLQSSRSKLSREKRSFVLTFDDGYEDFFTQAYPILHRYGFTATVFLVTDFVGERSLWEGGTGIPLLSWDQVEALFEAGISFGSHSCTHPHLLRLSNEQIRHELTASKERLEAKLCQEVPLLGYPYGESSGEIQRMSMEVGYRAACGVITGERGRFNLWRVPCGPQDTFLTFTFKLTRWYSYSLRLRRWARENTSVGRFLREVKHRWYSRRNLLSR